MEELNLVEPSIDYKDDVLNFLAEVKVADEGEPWQYAGMASIEESNSYEDWVQAKKDEANGINLPDGYVPASTYLCVRLSDNKVIGICSIRHELNDYLLNYWGHIGQSIRPDERGKGYGTKQLSLALDKCMELGIDNVLVACNEKNNASSRTIKKFLGEYENTVQCGDEILQRYWINLDKIRNLNK